MKTQQIEHINEVARAVHELARAKGWYDGNSPSGTAPQAEESAFIERACKNLHDEVSELHEAWRNGNLHEPCDKSEKMKEAGIAPISCLEDELADIIIRVMDNAQFLGVDLGSAVLRKHQFNATRGHRHGGKLS